LAAAAACAVTSHAHATIFTVSTAGVVKHGDDRLGLFGSPGAKLDGLPFYLAVSFDLDGTARYERDPLRYTRAYATEPFIVALTMPCCLAQVCWALRCCADASPAPSDASAGGT
jgi:hypothetical protein